MPEVFPEDGCKGTHLEPIMDWHDVGSTRGTAPRQKRPNRVLLQGAAPPTGVFQIGHGAQVIIEGGEIQSDGGEKDKDNPTTSQTKPTTAHRPRLHHQAVFLLY